MLQLWRQFPEVQNFIPLANRVQLLEIYAVAFKRCSNASNAAFRMPELLHEAIARSGQYIGDAPFLLARGIDDGARFREIIAPFMSRKRPATLGCS